MEKEPEPPKLIAGYEREFSEIEQMQKAHCVDYCLYRIGEEICLEVSDSLHPDSTTYFPMKKVTDNFAAGLLQFLYENAAPAENACDIAEDLYTHYTMAY